MKTRELQESQFPNCLVNWEIFWSTVYVNIQKIPILNLFRKLRKIKKSSYNNIQKSQISISLWIKKNLEVQP